MGKMHDKFKSKSVPIEQMIVPQATHMAGSTVIQQLGLDTPFGIQRMLMIFMSKFDPEHKGFFVDLKDMNQAVHDQVVEKRAHWLVHGHSDRIFFKMCTEEEFKALNEHAEATKQPGAQ